MRHEAYKASFDIKRRKKDLRQNKVLGKNKLCLHPHKYESYNYVITNMDSKELFASRTERVIIGAYYKIGYLSQAIMN